MTTLGIRGDREVSLFHSTKFTRATWGVSALLTRCCVRTPLPAGAPPGPGRRERRAGTHPSDRSPSLALRCRGVRTFSVLFLPIQKQPILLSTLPAGDRHAEKSAAWCHAGRSTQNSRVVLTSRRCGHNRQKHRRGFSLWIPRDFYRATSAPDPGHRGLLCKEQVTAAQGTAAHGVTLSWPALGPGNPKPSSWGRVRLCKTARLKALSLRHTRCPVKTLCGSTWAKEMKAVREWVHPDQKAAACGAGWSHRPERGP